MVYRKISLDLTRQQAHKAAQGKQITLSAAQLHGSGSTFHVHPANYDKIMKAKRAHKGTRIYVAPGAIAHDLASGGSFWSDLWSVVKTPLKAGLSGVLDAALPVVSGIIPGGAPIAALARQGIKHLSGVGVSGGKGTQAARDRMARVRAGKKGGRGGSFLLP